MVVVVVGADVAVVGAVLVLADVVVVVVVDDGCWQPGAASRTAF